MIRNVDDRDEERAGTQHLSNASKGASAPQSQTYLTPDEAGSTEPAASPRALTIVNKRGLHARASAKFVQTAEKYDAELSVYRDGLTVGGQSIMGLMMLAASQGTTIEVTATGREASEALEAIERLVASRFGEEA